MEIVTKDDPLYIEVSEVGIDIDYMDTLERAPKLKGLSAKTLKEVGLPEPESDLMFRKGIDKGDRFTSKREAGRKN